MISSQAQTTVLLREKYRAHPKIQDIVGRYGQLRESYLYQLSGSARALAFTEIYQHAGGFHLILLPEKEDAAYFYNDLLELIDDQQVLFFPSSYKRSIQYRQEDPGNQLLRTEVLNYVGSGRRKGVIVSYPEALMEKVIERRKLKKNTFSIRKGDRLNPEFLEEVLAEYHFSRTDFVYEPGQYAIRGSIVDIFSFSFDLPYRLDFMGEEVDSIRTFQTDTQLSVQRLDRMSLVPNVQDLEMEESRESFLEFLPDTSVLWLEKADYMWDRINSIYHQTRIEKEDGSPMEKKEFILTGNRLKSQSEAFKRFVLGGTNKPEGKTTFHFRTEPQPAFNKNFEVLADRLQRNEQEGYTNYILSSSDTQFERLTSIFAEKENRVHFVPVRGTLHRGFTDPELKICCYTDHQIFDRYHRFRIKGQFSRKESITIKELTGLHPGDYVVHIDHGIGKFGGLEKIEVNGKYQEAIKLVYKDKDILYVGIHALHRISKYKGKDGGEPKIYKLGTGAWQKIKQKTRSRVKDIAKDLIALYAKRKESQGFAFSPDSFLQRELEASFLYEDTPDQLESTRKVKEDMESPSPMDRLVCGDVGFGKTEIAIRAAFKAAADNKQTAVLVPTTILALQHYNTLSERLKDFPVNVEYISRLRPAATQKEILKKLEEGRVDIIIGTHRLVGKDIKFKDLGLLIVDEEQKFGVSVKEKLKNLKLNVDTLTLTATPIPRTLQFSLMGARDLSIIQTAPQNRMPIITELHGFNEDIIKEGIEYEVSRNGQVFIIHNRVDNIKDIEALVQRLVPQVRTVIAHGQMEGKNLENIMLDFIQGDYDVLIATTIIESGLDIPNANTIIINNAHHFGLSDLHQLRGRVGRSNKKAFCYLLAPPLQVLTPEARRRLRAIEEFSDLGSGFNIAMQDLDIRGAGNLLGGEQSGFIADIGFETYQRILAEAIAELKEGEFKDLFPEDQQRTAETLAQDCQIDTDLEIMFPDRYIESISERIELYRKLNKLKTEEDLHRFEQELVDRFGSLPPPAKELLNLVRLRWSAVKLGVEKLILKKGKLILHFSGNPDSAFYTSGRFMQLMQYVSQNPRKFRVKESSEKLSVVMEQAESVYGVLDTLKQMAD